MKYYLSAPECIYKPVREKMLSDGTSRNYLLSFAGSVKNWRAFYNKGLNGLMIDSGAFSAWNSGKIICINEYLNFCKQLPSEVYKINLDVIPRTGARYDEKELCIKQSFDNYLFLRSKIDNVLPVHHYGEDIMWAKRMLNETDYICISPANDTHETIKREYFKYIFSELDLNVKTHVLGYSSLEGIKQFPFYSTDSISYKQTHMNGRVLFTRSDMSVINMSMSEYGKYKKIKYNPKIGLSEQPEILEAGTLDTINSLLTFYDLLDIRNKTHNFSYLKTQLKLF